MYNFYIHYSPQTVKIIFKRMMKGIVKNCHVGAGPSRHGGCGEEAVPGMAVRVQFHLYLKAPLFARSLM